MSNDQTTPPETAPKKPENSGDLLGMLDYYLGTHARATSALRNTSQLDGFCAALACSPIIILPEIWIDEVWGGHSNVPEWNSAKEAQEFHNMLLAFHNHVVKDVGNGDYEPLFQEQTIGGKVYEIVHPWCKGFNAGSDLWRSYVQTAEVEALLNPMQTLGADETLTLSRDQLSALKQSILPNVRKLYEHFEAQRAVSAKHNTATTTVMHGGPKVGRNDPCLCGSGKKYKKCCLQ